MAYSLQLMITHNTPLQPAQHAPTASQLTCHSHIMPGPETVNLLTLIRLRSRNDVTMQVCKLHSQVNDQMLSMI
jgi:hypothetical protein